ncbi:hypothetical protein C8D77_101204 [Mesorhizobium loti]|uniref:Uncharacterized protein n=1 Tax=Rhizobium loti TaxID=381 RepID=A0A8E2WFX1_RHILI|nr:hypothetical protein [Mesorhizobium loti]PWJ93525.1 hypothetical protein C8D77_101204 [Mesorhizobium loti]
MTMLKVLKAFNTRVQRFKAGDEIPDDTDLSPHPVGGLTERGFLQAPSAPKSAKSKQAEMPAEQA